MSTRQLRSGNGVRVNGIVFISISLVALVIVGVIIGIASGMA